MCKALRTLSLHLVLGTQQALRISCGRCQPTAGHAQLGWPGLERTELSIHSALQQVPSMGQEGGGWGRGRWRTGGLLPGSGASLRLDVSRPHCGSRGRLWKELKNDRNFPNLLFFHSPAPWPPIFSSYSEQHFEMCQEQEGESVKTPERIVNPESGWCHTRQRSCSGKVCV